MFGRKRKPQLPRAIAIGDHVKPLSHWEHHPNQLPSGRVVATAPWGRGSAIWVEGNHRAWASDCFELVATDGAVTK